MKDVLFLFFYIEFHGFRIIVGIRINMESVKKPSYSELIVVLVNKLVLL